MKIRNQPIQTNTAGNEASKKQTDAHTKPRTSRNRWTEPDTGRQQQWQTKAEPQRQAI